MKSYLFANGSNKKSRTKAAAFICACALVITSSAGCTIDLTHSSQKSSNSVTESSSVSSAAETEETEKISVPGLESLSVDTAKDILNEAGLFYNVKEEESDEAENTVIMQYPEKGEKVEKGSTVTLVVAVSKSVTPSVSSENGSDMILVKNFVGQSYDQAKQYYEDNGIIVTRTDEWNSHYPYGTVISQSIMQNYSTNSYIKKGSTISFVMSLGTKSQTTYPTTSTPVERKVATFSSVTSSGYLPDEYGYTYKPENVLNFNGKCWSENAKGVGIDEYVMFSSSTTVAVSSCGIVNGYTVDYDRFTKNGRLTKVTFQGDNSNDRFTFYVDKDSMAEQIFDFGRTIYTKNLKIIIADAVSGTKYDDTCISVIIPYQ